MVSIALLLASLFVLYRRGMMQPLVGLIGQVAPMPAQAAPGLTAAEPSLPAPEIPQPDNNPDARKPFPIGMCQWYGDQNDEYKDAYAVFPPTMSGRSAEVDNGYMSSFSGAGTACSPSS